MLRSLISNILTTIPLSKCNEAVFYRSKIIQRIKSIQQFIPNFYNMQPQFISCDLYLCNELRIDKYVAFIRFCDCCYWPGWIHVIYSYIYGVQFSVFKYFTPRLSDFVHGLPRLLINLLL